MQMKEKTLNARINAFLDRKAKQYPDLHLTDNRPMEVIHNHGQSQVQVGPHFFHGRIADVY